jgi:hypothetical protein
MRSGPVSCDAAHTFVLGFGLASPSDIVFACSGEMPVAGPLEAAVGTRRRRSVARGFDVEGTHEQHSP